MSAPSTAANAVDSPQVIRAMARSTLYWCFSLAGGYPTAERIQALREEVLPAAHAAAVIACKGLAPLIESLNGHLDAASLEEIQSQYHLALGHLPLPDCPPYESGYLGDNVFRQAHVMADVGGFYRAFGLRAGRREPERVDHVTTELEFMRVLTRKEALARVHHGRPQVDICRRAQRRFWREHLGVWLNTFAALVAGRVERGFYGAWGQALRTFAEAEDRTLGRATAVAIKTTDLETFGEMDCSAGADTCPLITLENRAEP